MPIVPDFPGRASVSSVNDDMDTPWSEEQILAGRRALVEQGTDWATLPTYIVRDLRLPERSVVALLIMSTVAAGDGVVCASDADLARRLDWGLQSFRNALKAAEKSGLISKQIDAAIGTPTWRLNWIYRG
jgi:hypothetical protein